MLSLAIGLALFAVVSLDILFTTIGAEEHAILSFRIARPVFRAVRGLGLQRRSDWMHRLIGPFIMFLLGAVWIIAFSLAWTLILAAFPSAVVAAEGSPEPGWWDIYAHVGHLLSTLGADTTKSGGTLSYVIGGVIAINGFVLVTLATSFTLSTTQTVVRGRSFASVAAVLDPADPALLPALAPELAQVCSALNASPFALFYSSPKGELRLPETVERFARRASQGEEFSRYRQILGQLPGLAASTDPPLSDNEFLDRLSSWARYHSFR